MILRADWVVPMDGPPIADGAVEIAGGRIVAVGPADGGEDARYADSVILPGLVNAHTHLEYSAMAGFGDGMPFSPWIADHIRRKDTQAQTDLLAQSRAGAAACLAGGVTTVADCCYAGTVAQAAAEAGLRAIVYLEGFSVWEELEARIEAALDALPTSDLVRAGVSPHAPFTVTHADYAMLVALARRRGLPVATHLLESDRETEHLDAFAGVLGPDTVVVHGVLLDDADIALLARARRPRRPLPALERAARLRDRAPERSAGGRSPGRPRHRLAVVGARLRHVGRDAHRDHARARPHPPGRRADGRDRAGAGHGARGRRDRARRRRSAR